MDNRSLVHEIITLNVTHRYRVGKAASSLGLYFGQPSILEFILQNNNCTQKELAERTGIHQADISKLENGTRNPSINLLKRLADGMDMALKIEFIPKKRLR